MIKQITTKRKSPPNKLERLMAQGNWVKTELPDGRIVPHFAMPTPELQLQLDEALESWVKKQLKADGYERICATRREHPFHTELFRERIDALATSEHVFLARGPYHFDPKWNDPQYIEATRSDLYKLIGDPDMTIRDKARGVEIPFTQYDADQIIEDHMKTFRAYWAAAISKYRDMLRDPAYWRGTKMWKLVFRSDGPPLPDQLPKPVYVNKQCSDLVIQLQDSWVNLYSKVAA